MKRFIIRIVFFIGIFNVGVIAAGPIDDLGQAIAKGNLRGFVKVVKSASEALEKKGELAIREVPGGLDAAVDSLGKVLKGISQMRLTNIKAAPEGKKGINIAAKATAFGKAANIDVVLDITKKGGYATIGVDAIKFSEIHSIFKVVDNVFQIKKPTFKIATVELIDRDKQKLVSYKKGLNFSANIGAGGFVEGLLRQRVEAQAEGVIANDKQLIGSEINLKIPTKSDLGLGLTLDESALSILTRRDPTTNQATVAVGIKTGLQVVIPTQPTPLNFKVKVAFDTVPTGKVSVEGLMEGKWVNAFGFPFVVLEDVGINFAKTYASGNQPLTEVAVKGAMTIGSKKANIVIQVKAPVAGKKSVSIVGSIEGGLKLSDIADLASKATKGKISIDKLPNLGLEHAQVYIVTEKTALIFGKSYSRGVYIAGEATLFGKKAKIVFSIDPKQGIVGEGYMQGINIGVLKLTGVGLDKKKNTPDDGLAVRLDLTKQKQGLFLSGDAQFNLPGLGGVIRQAVDIEVSAQEGVFQMRQEVLGFSMLFDTSIPLKDIANATVEIKGEQSALQKMRQLFNSGLDLAKKAADKAFKVAQKAFDFAKQGFGEAKKGLDAAKRAFDKAKGAVDAAERKLTPFKGLKARAEERQRECNKIKDRFLNAAKEVTKAIRNPGETFKKGTEAVKKAFGVGGGKVLRVPRDNSSYLSRFPHKPAGWDYPYLKLGSGEWRVLGPNRIWENVAYGIKTVMYPGHILRIITWGFTYEESSAYIDLAIQFAREVGNEEILPILQNYKGLSERDRINYYRAKFPITNIATGGVIDA